MMIRKVALLILLTCFCLYTLAQNTEPTLREKVGQMIVAGFKGTEPSDEIMQAIRDDKIGGIILFSADVSAAMGVRNISSPEQLARLTGQLQGASSVPLFIAIDQEGGRVNRLATKFGFPSSVSAEKLGSINIRDTTRAWAEKCVATLNQVGVNVNFAPCVDLNVNPNNPVIGAKERSFGAEAEIVTQNARWWIECHNEHGILTSLKHFPGHGSSLADSHLGMTDITETWSSTELDPYKELIDGGYDDIVMIGHLFNRSIDPDYPSSLSRATITGLLREKLGYDGVVCTDDMNMGAIVEHYSSRNALKMCINAGVDMIIIGNNGNVFEKDLIRKTCSSIIEMVQNGEIPQSRIDEAFDRIMKLKKRYIVK